MNYQVITDQSALDEFVEWLPDLERHEKYYICLLARKKYCAPGSGIKFTKTDKTQLRRFLTDKERMVDKIRQLEVPMNRWKIKDSIAPQESLALYITPNPRSMLKANSLMVRKCLDFIESAPDGGFNIAAEALSCVQKAKSRSCFVDFDIDTKDVDLVDIDDVIGTGYFLLETRGGYHLLVDPKKAGIYNKHWHPNLLSHLGDIVDVTADQMIPVPGCVQGGFTPVFR